MAASRTTHAASPSTIEPLGTASGVAEQLDDVIAQQLLECADEIMDAASTTPSTFIACAFETGPVHCFPRNRPPTVIPS